jgi:hypothetical protein
MITKKEFFRALKKRTEADLIISKYNLQESLKMADIYDNAKSISHTFQNGFKSDSDCFNEALAYLIRLKDNE